MAGGLAFDPAEFDAFKQGGAAPAAPAAGGFDPQEFASFKQGAGEGSAADTHASATPVVGEYGGDTGLYALHRPTMPSLASVFRGAQSGGDSIGQTFKDAYDAVRSAGSALGSMSPSDIAGSIKSGAHSAYDYLTTPGPGKPSLIGMVREAGKAGQGGLTLTREALDGTLDPTSPDAVKRAADLAMIASPMSAGGAGARGGVTAVAPLAAPVADAERLNIRLSAGQRTGDPALLSREDAMMGGALGDPAQKVAQDFRLAQREDIANAGRSIEQAAGRGQADLERNQDAGQAVMDAVRDRAAEAKSGYKDRYGVAFAQDGTLDPAVFTGRQVASEAHPNPATAIAGPAGAPDEFAAPMSRRITDALVGAQDPVIIDPVLTPAAHRALGTLDNIDNLKLGSIGQPGAADTVTGINLRGVDQARRQLAAHAKAASANPADKRAVGAIIDQFDNQIQTAMENGMFSGSDEALGALKDARQAYASYRRTFTQQGGKDDVGRVMDEIITRDATPEQVANRLYGGVKAGQNPTSVRLADRLKNVLGEESPEWAGIRQGAWQRVLGSMDQSPQRAATRILDFVNGDGRSLATRLFSEDERQNMTTLANVIRATAGRAGTTNASNSGNRLAGLMRKSLTAIGASIGGTAIPHVPPVVGSAVGAIIGRGAETLGSAKNAAEARQLFAGEVPTTIGQRLAQIQRPVVALGQRRFEPISHEYLMSGDDRRRQ